MYSLIKLNYIFYCLSLIKVVLLRLLFLNFMLSKLCLILLCLWFSHQRIWFSNDFTFKTIIKSPKNHLLLCVACSYTQFIKNWKRKSTKVKYFDCPLSCSTRVYCYKMSEKLESRNLLGIGKRYKGTHTHKIYVVFMKDFVFAL